MSETFESLTGLALLTPWLLLLVALVPVALWVRRRRGAPAVRFAPIALFREKIPRSWRSALLPVPRTLQAIGLVLVVVALARPALRTRSPLQTEGIDILMCLDISSSMTANDMDARRARLAVAKDAAARFIEGRPDDRIGLICFARYPDVRCPLTLDHDALTTILAGVTTVESEGPEDATGIGTAVVRAAQVLADSAATSRVVILLTDGEENVATKETPGEIAPLHAGQLCERLGVRVYTIAAGVGRPGPSGEWVAIDTGQVERLSRRTAGRFFAAPDAAAVASVYESIDQLEKIQLAEPRYEVEERFLPFVLAGVAFLLVSRLLASTILWVRP